MSILLPVSRTSRRPPMPVVPEGGACRWCTTPLLHPATHKDAGKPNMRRRWCSEKETTCVRDYLIAAHQGDARKALWKRDRGRCGLCGVQCGGRRGDWDADHRIPLWSAPSHILLEDRGTLWGLENLWTLCVPCHKEKTAKEAGLRAEVRRAAKAAGKPSTKKLAPARKSPKGITGR